MTLNASVTQVGTSEHDESLDGFDSRPWYLRGRLGWYLLFMDCTAFLAAATTSTAFHPLQVLVLFELCSMLSLFGKLYRSRLTLSVLDDLPYLVGGTLICLLTEFSLETLTGSNGTTRPRAEQMAALLAFLLTFRCSAYAFVRRARRSGLVRHRVLILGAGSVGAHLADNLQRHPEYGLDPVGYWDPHPRQDFAEKLDIPIFSGQESLARLIERRAVKLVVIAFGRAPESELVEVLRTCDRLHCEIYMVPRLFELHAVTHDMDSAWSIPLVRIHRAPFRSISWKIKRLLDISLAAAALILTFPILAVCFVAVRLEGGPGVIFKQERVGLDGRPLTLFKFRSLRPVNDNESATMWNVAHDARLGKVGRFLRRTSLDELPQLWNVLTGAMSLVGPRPERPHFADEFARTVPNYASRHRVPAGLTGLSQIHGLRGDTSIDDRATFDNIYVENWTLWGDVKIMLRTLRLVVGRAGS